MFEVLRRTDSIFTAKTCLDVFNLSQEQVWTFSVLGDRIYEMRCPFVAVGLNARLIVLPHWDNILRTYSSPGGSIRSPHPGPPRGTCNMSLEVNFYHDYLLVIFSIVLLWIRLDFITLHFPYGIK